MHNLPFFASLLANLGVHVLAGECVVEMIPETYKCDNSKGTSDPEQKATISFKEWGKKLKVQNSKDTMAVMSYDRVSGKYEPFGEGWSASWPESIPVQCAKMPVYTYPNACSGKFPTTVNWNRVDLQYQSHQTFTFGLGLYAYATWPGGMWSMGNQVLSARFAMGNGGMCSADYKLLEVMGFEGPCWNMDTVKPIPGPQAVPIVDPPKPPSLGSEVSPPLPQLKAAWPPGKQPGKGGGEEPSKAGGEASKGGGEASKGGGEEPSKGTGEEPSKGEEPSGGGGGWTAFFVIFILLLIGLGVGAFYFRRKKLIEQNRALEASQFVPA